MIGIGQEQWCRIQQEWISGRGKSGQEWASAGKYRQQQASVDGSEQRRAGQAQAVKREPVWAGLGIF